MGVNPSLPARAAAEFKARGWLIDEGNISSADLEEMVRVCRALQLDISYQDTWLVVAGHKMGDN